MGTGPEEWVMVTRSRGRFWGALMLRVSLRLARWLRARPEEEILRETLRGVGATGSVL